MADNEKIDDRKANADWFTLFLAGAFGGGGGTIPATAALWAVGNEIEWASDNTMKWD